MHLLERQSTCIYKSSLKKVYSTRAQYSILIVKRPRARAQSRSASYASPSADAPVKHNVDSYTEHQEEDEVAYHPVIGVRYTPLGHMGYGRVTIVHQYRCYCPKDENTP